MEHKNFQVPVVIQREGLEFFTMLGGVKKVLQPAGVIALAYTLQQEDKVQHSADIVIERSGNSYTFKASFTKDIALYITLEEYLQLYSELVAPRLEPTISHLETTEGRL